ncbi:MAG: MotA/TolQ/ExbB proton channel family protein [Betaproteobacteria bacterium]|jgi:biopolymer transport protein ExbB/TolQ|nr:MotA/TolQ/ExbB proton channel family protein [Rubrivivax sp.]
MNLTSMIEQFLYVVSSALYLPVIGACAVLVLYVPWLAGMLVYDVMARRRGQRAAVLAFRRALAQLQPAGVDRDVAVEWLLQQHEGLLTRALDRVRFVIKVGPALGLMGTLIPMGISLSALAGGNIPQMAGSMVTAFTATVAGLAAGTAAYLIALVRERWAREDLRDMAFEAESAVQAPSTEPAPAQTHPIQAKARHAIP